MNVFGQHIEAVHLLVVGYMVAVPVAALVLVFVHGCFSVFVNKMRGRKQ